MCLSVPHPSLLVCQVLEAHSPPPPALPSAPLPTQDLPPLLLLKVAVEGIPEGSPAPTLLPTLWHPTAFHQVQVEGDPPAIRSQAQ